MKRFVLFLFSTICLVGCNSFPVVVPIPQSTVEVDGTVDAAVSTAIAEIPTQTPYPTYTPFPDSSTTPEDAASSFVAIPLDDDTTMYEYPLDGFSIVLPNEWLVSDLEDENIADMLSLMGEQNEGLDTLLSSDFKNNMIAAGIKLYAINTDIESLQSLNPVNLNILTVPLPFRMDTNQYLILNAAQIEQFLDLTSDTNTEMVTLGEDLEAGKMSYTANLINIYGLPMEVAYVQYLLIDNGTAFILTITIPIELVEIYQAEAIEIVETFRFLE